MSDAVQVREAAAALVAAFARHDVEAYFASFAPEATFLFHNLDHVLANRAEYEAQWASWEAEGLRVLSCTSSNGVIQMIGPDAAIFQHTVRTTLAYGEGSVHSGERETIVFERIDGAWRGVHEHLSLDPTFEAQPGR